ncbi:hypothetical protein [Schlesneria sp.]|uniref:hypothetical protein n=1 Tax=Schlesneria sp. TaxID=2762018 RepID=UPI002F10E2EE
MIQFPHVSKTDLSTCLLLQLTGTLRTLVQSRLIVETHVPLPEFQQSDPYRESKPFPFLPPL